ncbi:MAG: HEAT repeat domain-containing protein [Planctomycetota bacterium]|jgi:hypothetical protein
MSRTLTVLHLSDSHIGKKEKDFEENNHLVPLLDDLERVSDQNKWMPDLILFSGDIVFGRIPDSIEMDDQYTKADKFIGDIYSKLNIEQQHVPILIVPGNHDVNRSSINKIYRKHRNSLTEDDINEYVEKESEELKELTKSQLEWRKFVKKYHNSFWNFHEPLGSTWGIIKAEDIKVGVIGLNSSWLCCGGDDKDHLWIGKFQYDTLYSKVKDCHFKIAVSHHPLTWLREADGKYLRRKIETQCQMYFHGHEHDQWFTIQDDHIKVESGACYDHKDKQTGYSWINLDFTTGDFEILLREYKSRGEGGWIPNAIPGKTKEDGSKKQTCEWLKYSRITDRESKMHSTVCLDRLIDEWEKGSTSSCLIETTVRDKHNKLYDSLASHLDELLDSPNNNLRRITLLGDYGSGKTTFLKHYAYQLAKKTLNGEDVLVPVYIDLKNFVSDPSTSIGESIRQQIEACDPNANPEMLDDVRSRFLIIMDSYDELSVTTDKAAIYRNAKVINQILLNIHAPVIIACRTHFFETTALEELFERSLLLYVQPWTNDKVEEYLDKSRTNNRNRSAIYRNSTMKELAATPLFLNMMIEISEERKIPDSITKLYQSYIKRKLEHEILVYFTIDSLLNFLRQLAWDMLLRKVQSVPYSELRTRTTHFFGEGGQWDAAVNEIYTRSILVRRHQKGSYGFSHNSFREFFVAKYLADRLASKPEDGLNAIRQCELPREEIDFLAELIESDRGLYAKMHSWLNDKEQPQYALARRNIANTLLRIHNLSLKSNKHDDSFLSKQCQISQDGRKNPKDRCKALIEIAFSLRHAEPLPIEYISCFRNIIKDNRSVPWEVLRYALVLLGLLQDVESKDVFLDLLLTYGDSSYSDEQRSMSHKIRQNCAVALAFLTSDVNFDPETRNGVVARLKEIMDHDREKHPEVRRSIIWAMETIDRKNCLKVIIKTAQCNEEDVEVRRYAIMTIAQNSADADIETLLRIMHADSPPLIRKTIIEGLASRIDLEDVRRCIEQCSADQDSEVREAAKIAMDAWTREVN